MNTVTIRRLLTVAGLVALAFPFAGCADAPLSSPLSLQNSESYSQVYGGAPLHRSCVTPPCGN
jgi:hypothetical protein